MAKTVTMNLSEDKTYFWVKIGDETGLVSVNLIKHQLEIPYQKKDGTEVSVEEIRAQKAESEETLKLLRQRAELDNQIRESRKTTKKKVS